MAVLLLEEFKDKLVSSIFFHFVDSSLSNECWAWHNVDESAKKLEVKTLLYVTTRYMVKSQMFFCRYR